MTNKTQKQNMLRQLWQWAGTGTVTGIKQGRVTRAFECIIVKAYIILRMKFTTLKNVGSTGGFPTTPTPYGFSGHYSVTDVGH